MTDSVRGDSGAGGFYALHPNTTSDNQTNSTNSFVTAIGSDGFTLGSNDTVNVAQPFVSYNWFGGTSSGITTNGATTITPSAYSFNATSKFSVLKYTGNGTGGAKLAHGLGVAPEFILIKNLGSANGWGIYHANNEGFNTTSASANEILILNTDAGRADDAAFFNDTAPDSVNITFGNSGTTNDTDNTYIAYCFASVKGYSQIGQYKGNGEPEGPMIYTGFRPAWCLIKQTNTSGQGWGLFDSTRGVRNVNEWEFQANTTAAENLANHEVDFYSNGINIRTNGAMLNGSGTYCYLAFAEFPVVASNNTPAVAK